MVMGCLDEAKRISLTNKAPVVRHAAPVSRPDSAVLAPLGVSGLRAPQRSQMRPTRTLNSPRQGNADRRQSAEDRHPTAAAGRSGATWATWNTWDWIESKICVGHADHDACCVAGVGPVVWLVHSTFSSSSARHIPVISSKSPTSDQERACKLL